MLIPNLSAPLPIEALKGAGIHELPGGLKIEDFDYLHTSIFIDEVSFPPIPFLTPYLTSEARTMWNWRPRGFRHCWFRLRCSPYHKVRQQAAA